MKKKDFILIGIVFLIALAGFGFIRWTQHDGTQVIVTVDGEEVYRADLSKDQTYEIPVEEGTNVMKTQNGEVTMSKADCPDQICRNHAAISQTGETIVCLPHKAVIEITSETGTTELDGITQ